MSSEQPLSQQYLSIKQGRDWRSWPIVRQARMMRLRRLRPVDDGRSNGLSVIRYYWADYLDRHREDIRGHALEIGTTETIRDFGGARISQADAIDLAVHSPEVRVVADLSRADHVPSDVYDCFVNQFTTSVIYDIEAALYHAVRLLKPGGVLLINFWCVDYYLHRGLDMGTGAPLYMHWWFTPIQVQNMLRALALGDQDFRLDIYGNLLTRMAFLLNLPAKELTHQELTTVDPGQPLLICARIVKPVNWAATIPTYRAPAWTPSVEPDQLHPETGHYGHEYEQSN